MNAVTYRSKGVAEVDLFSEIIPKMTVQGRHIRFQNSSIFCVSQRVRKYISWL